MSKKKKLRWLTICYWFLVICITIFNIIQLIQSESAEFGGSVTALFQAIGNDSGVILKFIGIIIVLFVITALNPILIGPYIGIRLGYSKSMKEKLSKVDVKNDFYYRDIIPRYSPSVLSFIDNFELDEKDIVTTLLSLEMKGKIKIENQIQILNHDIENLNRSEKYIFSCLESNTLKELNFSIYEKEVIEDCLENDLLNKKKDLLSGMIKKFICFILIAMMFQIFMFFLGFSSFFGSANENRMILFFIIIVIGILVMSIGIPIFIYYICYYSIMSKKNPYIRNQKAEEINQKLEGLKKYLSDFSRLDEREKQEIFIWEDYLIYSVMFGQNTKIVKEIMDKIG